MLVLANSLSRQMLMTSSNGTHVNKLVTSKLAMKGKLEYVVTSLAKAKESFTVKLLCEKGCNNCKLNVLSRSGVVYQISCSQCEAFYVGKTKRRLEQRIQEHSQQGYSSLYKFPGYPANFINSIVHRFLSKQFSNTDVMQPYGPHKRRLYLCLPYIREMATNKFARQIRRLIAKIAPCVELRLVFRAAQKLSCLTRLKSKLNVLSRSGVVYQISCSQCEAFYVGKTKRRLEQRIQEHSQQGYSSLYKHSSDLCHQIDYSNPAVISVDNNDYRLQIKEALKIKDLKAYNSLNANIRSCELKL